MALQALQLLLTALGGPSASNRDGDVQLQESRRLKAKLREVASVFSDSPRQALQLMQTLEIIGRVDDHPAVAHLLRQCQVDKRALGEFLGKPDNVPLLEAFLADYDLAGLRVDEALRKVLQGFRLPGEAQQIERIMQAFAKIYHRSNQGSTCRSEDAVFILSYSITMLNTDLHSRQVRSRMTPDDFVKNNRGINDGQDFPRAYLQTIYDAIRSHEIVLPEEHEGEVAYAFQWAQVLERRPHLDNAVASAHDIVPLLWDALLNCLLLAMEMQIQSADDTLPLVIAALQSLAKVVCGTNQPTLLNQLLHDLWTCSTIPACFANNPCTIPRYLSRLEAGRELVKLFLGLVKRYGELLDSVGWTDFVGLLMIASDCGILVLSTTSNSGAALTASPTAFTLDAKKEPVPRSKRASKFSGKRAPTPTTAEGYSILNTLSSYYSGTASTGLDEEAKAKAGDFLSQCQLEEVFAETRLLSLTPLQHLLEALLAPLKQLAAQASGSSSETLGSPNLTAKRSQRPTETLVLLIDVALYVALQNRDRLQSLWGPLFGTFSAVSVSSQADLALAVREHVTLALGKLTLKTAERTELQAHVLDYLKLLCQMPPDFFINIAEPCLAVIVHLLEVPNGALLRDSQCWPHFFTILSLVSRLPHCSPMTCTLLVAVAQSPVFPVDFFGEYLDLCQELLALLPKLTDEDLQHSTLVASSSPMDFGRRLVICVSDVPFADADKRLQVLQFVAALTRHPLRDLRVLSLSILQKRVLEETILPSSDLLERLLLPALDGLSYQSIVALQAKSASSGLVGSNSNYSWEEVQTRLASLTCKFVLSRCQELGIGTSAFDGIWRATLRNLLGLVGKQGEAREAVSEALKNAMSVLGSLELMTAELQALTLEIVDPILPEVRRSLQPANSALDPDPAGSAVDNKSDEKGTEDGANEMRASSPRPSDNNKNAPLSPNAVVHVV